MRDLVTRLRCNAGIAGNSVAGNLLIELVEEIKRLRDLAARVIEADDEARQDYGGALMLLAALADELRPAKPVNLDWTVKPATGTVFSAAVDPDNPDGLVDVSNIVLPGPKGPDLAARLDRIEKWLTATHGYPYPGKD
jgi:hypothetical protein